VLHVTMCAQPIVNLLYDPEIYGPKTVTFGLKSNVYNLAMLLV